MDKNRIISALLTALLIALAILLMVSCHLRYQYPPEGVDLSQLEQDSIMFGGEFVMLGNQLDPSESEQMDTESPTDAEVAPEPNVEGDDLDDAGEPAHQAKPLVSAKDPSPMKVKEQPKTEKPKKTGPATDTKPDPNKERVKRGQQTSDADKRTASAFGKSSGSGSGKQGSPNGNSTQGALSGKPGIGGLVGYTLEYWGRPHSYWTGSVTVRVRVNARGKVIEAKVHSGKGEAWSHNEVRRSCEQESLKSAFSVPKNTTQEGVGYITWTFI